MKIFIIRENLRNVSACLQTGSALILFKNETNSLIFTNFVDFFLDTTFNIHGIFKKYNFEGFWKTINTFQLDEFSAFALKLKFPSNSLVMELE